MNTMQQEFDAVVQHLYKQGRPALAQDACKYRTLDGLMCAVGCRIPDEMYVPEMDSAPDTTIGVILQRFKFPREIYEYKDMFKALQKIHDNWNEEPLGLYSFGAIEKHLVKCAESYNLTYNSPVGQTPQEPK